MIMNTIYSQHANKRLANRSITELEVELVLLHGEEINQHGSTVYFIGERLYQYLHSMGILAPKNVAVVVSSEDGTVISAVRTTDRRRLVKTRVRHKKRANTTKSIKRGFSTLQ